MMNNREIEENFEEYSSHKKGELEIEIDGQVCSARIFFFDEDFMKKHFTPHSDGRIIISKEVIEKFNPDNIDNSYFWKLAAKSFPVMAIGDKPEWLHTDDLRIKNFDAISNLHKPLGALSCLCSFLDRNPNARILEIGPGFGNIKKYIENHYNIENYYAMDICPHFEFERLYKCDGKNIPKEVPYPIDIVYAVNVFQHLTKEQKRSYYKQIEIILREGGEFIFQSFVATEKSLMEKNENNEYYFGVIDEDGQPYVHFFNQITPVDFLEDIIKEFEDLDLNLVDKVIFKNVGIFRAIKN